MRRILAPALQALAGAAAIALGAQLSVVVGPTPTTLQSVAAILVGGLAGTRIGVAAVALYLAAVLAGAPLLAQGRSLSTATILGGATIGWIVGLAAAAAIAGSARRWARADLRRWIGVTIVAHLVLVCIGVAWAGSAVATPLFLLLALAKAIIAAVLLASLRSVLR